MQSLPTASSKKRHISGPVAVLIIVTAALVVGMFDVAPVRSQFSVLEAAATSEAVPTDDPWAAIWDDAPSLQVPLSAQDISFPYGGGSVNAVTVRSVFDAERVYISMEWSDPAPNDTVAGAEQFSDAAALQFPSKADASPPYTMGSANQPVNIWQWKAAWQADIERGFPTSADRHPNTYVDSYPNADDPIFNPAAHLGNPVAQPSHSSPIENLLAEGFGTLTSVEIQDVIGSGEWRDGSWRVVFARTLQPSTDDHTTFTPGTTTLVAFAVWDGAAGDRNGQKSVAQFVELDMGPVDRTATNGDDQALALGEEETAIPWAVLALAFGAVAPIVVMVIIAIRQSTRPRLE